MKKATNAKAALTSSSTAAKPSRASSASQKSGENRQKLKLLYLMQMLMNETDSTQGLTMTEILTKLEEQGISAERKSIYRDLDTLRDFGMNIGVLHRAPVQYVYERDSLTVEQLALLIDAVQSSKFLTDRTSAQLTNSLRNLASERERKLLDKRVHVEGRIKSKSDSVFHNVDTIHAALQNRHKIQFNYYKYDSHKLRTAQHDGRPYVVTPVRVIFADSFYYLAAWNDDNNEIRTYRIDRMELLHELPERAVRNDTIASYNYEHFEYQAFGMFTGEPVWAKLLVQPEAIDVVIDRFGLGVEMRSKAGGKAEARVPVLKSPQFFGWIAGMDGAITLAGPKKLVTEYKAWLQGLIEGEE